MTFGLSCSCLKVLLNKLTQCRLLSRIRAYGSAAYDMCQIARGCGEAYMEHGIHVWDIAAGKVIVEEAGGVVTDPSGRL